MIRFYKHNLTLWLWSSHYCRFLLLCYIFRVVFSLMLWEAVTALYWSRVYAVNWRKSIKFWMELVKEFQYVDICTVHKLCYLLWPIGLDWITLVPRGINFKSSSSKIQTCSLIGTCSNCWSKFKVLGVF